MTETGGSRTRGSKQALAERAWKRMFEFLIATAPRRNAGLGRRNLSPNVARALNFLDGETGHPLNALAREWNCDPSNATAIVDRLERAGLAERRPMEGDRRVKLVALTERGLAMKQELMAEFLAPPEELLALTRSDLEALERVLGKLRY